MSDQTEAPNEATTADEPVAEQATEAAQVEAGEATEGEGDDAAPEVVEIEFGGRKIALPKGVVPDDVISSIDDYTKSLMGDYTRKTQDVAEQRKAVAEEREVLAQMSQMGGELQTAYSAGLQIRADIEYLSRIDLSALWQSDPDQARRISDTLSKRQADFNAAVAKVGQIEQAQTAVAQQHAASAEQAGRLKVEKAIKGFDGAAERELIEYVGKTYGIPEADAKSWPMNPNTAIMAYKAMQYDKLQAQAVKATIPATKAAPVVAPLKVKAGSSPVNPDKLSTEQWMRQRDQEIRSKRA